MGKKCKGKMCMLGLIRVIAKFMKLAKKLPKSWNCEAVDNYT